MSAAESQKSQKSLVINTLIQQLKTSSVEDFNQSKMRRPFESTEAYISNYKARPIGYARDVANLKKVSYMSNPPAAKSAFAKTFEMTQ